MRIPRYHLPAIHCRSCFLGCHRRADNGVTSSPRTCLCPIYAHRFQEQYGREHRRRRGCLPSCKGRTRLRVCWQEGLSSIVETVGNEDIHVILRGGKSGTNYDEKSVDAVVADLRKASVNHRIMVRTIRYQRGIQCVIWPRVDSLSAD